MKKAAASKAAAIPTFEGFADRDARFFRALARNQRRDWFEAHRKEYEQGWLGPMKLLLTELRDRFDPIFPRHPLAPPKVFRIYRDVRFSKDKSPYKTHIGGYVGIEGTGAGPSGIAALYVHIGAGELFVAAGHYMMDGPQLARFRAALLDDERGEAIAALLRRLERAGFEPGAHETLQRVPRGMDPEHPRADLLKRKGLIVSFPDVPRKLLTTRALLDWLVTHTKRVAPVVEWLASLDE